MIIWGYIMWIKRPPTQLADTEPARQAGYFLPLLGISLLAFVLIDAAVGYLNQLLSTVARAL